MKKGFTLIELLVVIVILAIIALIAVPIVINIVNDSKESTEKEGISLYIDTVEKTITKKQLSDPSFNPDKCEIQDNGDLKCYKNNELIDTLQVEMKGKMPNRGTIELKNNKFKYKNIWFNNKKYYAIATLLDDADNNNEISIGDKYSYRVNDSDIFNFYVLSENDDNTVNLIMDRNICEDGNVTDADHTCTYAWCNIGNYYNQGGPVTAMEILYNATKDWYNIPDMIMNYTDFRHYYGTIKTEDYVTTITKKDGTITKTIGNISNPLKARLPDYIEIRNAGCGWWGDSNPKICPVWLVEYLDVNISNYNEDVSTISGINGYWLLSGDMSILESNFVYKDGNLASGYVTTSTVYGLRPVITVPISDLE